ncbi:hypothetical protein LTR56_010576 [Elasticomyces elasticus]|nr:hypothetical protein LTR56_010576 [Elasticomyces elasticus]KAK3648685.1 hypothetical protein LTR22_013321 [Elasticomyces elasticus]KAK4932432.1 hypothetical protein LTR49_001301 [Elasticomyces elasticus]KAK5760133.1 hypothetical protein LTS12_009688 [Elasticomyces elasticus]
MATYILRSGRVAWSGRLKYGVSSQVIQPNPPPVRLFSACSVCLRSWDRPQGIDDALGKSQGAPQAVLSPAGLQLQKPLLNNSADPVKTFRDRLQAGSTDLETTRVCLQVYYDRLTKVKRAERRTMIQNDNIGGLSLQWLWSEQRRWVRAVTSDVMSLQRICYFAVAESLDDLLVQSLALPLPPLLDQAEEALDTHQWRGAVLREIIRSHLMLDSNSSADEAIDKFFKVADLVLVARSAPLRPKSPLARTSLYPAEVELIKQLCTTRFYKTDPARYDNFARFVAGGKRFTQFTGAQLALAHPTLPDAQPALSYAHKFVEPLSKPELQRHFPT